MIEFFLPMLPPTVTAQEHKVTVRGGKPQYYDPPELKDARAKLTAHLAPHAPPAPITDGVRLTVKWCFPLPANGSHKNGEYKTTKPDTDNLQKLLKDCMTACCFWKDDALVCSEIVEKFWAELPGIYIRIERIYETKTSDSSMMSIVRCKNCIACLKEDDQEYWCMRVRPGFLVRPDGFCSNGEPKR